MVGVFINTLPCWVPIEERRPIRDWLRDVQMRQQRLAAYEQCALSDIRTWCGWPVLFNTIVVIQQVFHPVDGQSIGGLRIGALDTRGQPNYPLLLRVTPGDRVRIEVVYDRRRIRDVLAADLLVQVQQTLGALPTQVSNDDIATVTASVAAAGDSRSGNAVSERRDSMSQTVRTGGPRLMGVSPKPRAVRAEDMVSQDTQTTRWDARARAGGASAGHGSSRVGSYRARDADRHPA